MKNADLDSDIREQGRYVKAIQFIPYQDQFDDNINHTRTIRRSRSSSQTSSFRSSSHMKPMCLLSPRNPNIAMIMAKNEEVKQRLVNLSKRQETC